IAILRDGSMYFGQDKVSADQIANRIREKVRAGSERRAYIKVDGRVRYGHVVNVINAVSDAGISDIGFFADQRKAMPEPVE
ncbi:biopolymer transporter ExbD, partial [Klebsiella pneumoniae]|uniref:ExbD/TolR family protein n=1 Tax=Klebsiella pneumoniae TaxID=573 RepID=UPI003013C282